jgi:regulatory protein
MIVNTVISLVDVCMCEEIKKLQHQVDAIAQSIAPVKVVLVLRPDDFRRIKWSAMELLARREHSVKELKAKLIKRYPEGFADIEQCLIDLQSASLQSDARFCEAYVSMRSKKGFGPLRIVEELRNRGVAEALLYKEIFNRRYDWFEVATIIWQKKFKGIQARDLKEKAKQIRFLHYRGFGYDYIGHLV